MPLIEKISQMQQQGLNENQIIKQLREQGFSPKQIKDALEQSSVKSAIYKDMETEDSKQEADSGNMEGMQQSMMEQQNNHLPLPQQNQEQEAFNSMQKSSQTKQAITQEQFQQPSPYPGQTEGQAGGQGKIMSREVSEQEQYPQAPQPMPQEQFQQPYPGQYDYSEQYPEYGQYDYGSDTETVSDIAEQIVSEKLEKIRQQINEMIDFKTRAQGKIKNIDKRLTKIEGKIDKLQDSIIGRIGKYGQDISDLKDEMIATQESFSKVVNPISKNMEKLRKISGQEPRKNTRQKPQINEENEKSDNSDTEQRTREKDNKEESGFENFLRR
jgi:hypothetical protein